MDIEEKQKVINHIKEFQLKQYNVLEKIQIQLLDSNKFLYENKPYLDKMFYNEDLNLDNYVNDFLLPEMKKTYPGSKIKKEVIGEIIGFDN